MRVLCAWTCGFRSSVNYAQTQSPRELCNSVPVVLFFYLLPPPAWFVALLLRARSFACSLAALLSLVPPPWPDTSSPSCWSSADIHWSNLI